MYAHCDTVGIIQRVGIGFLLKAQDYPNGSIFIHTWEPKAAHSYNTLVFL